MFIVLVVYKPKFSECKFPTLVSLPEWRYYIKKMIGAFKLKKRQENDYFVMIYAFLFVWK